MSADTHIEAVVGLRQVLRELKNGNIQSIVLATDADKKYKNTILSSAKIANVPVTIASTSEKIAQKYGIEVKSAVVGFLKPTANQC